ncbi:unnamed protein product [Owenia fusiformis]|uniref:Multiple epidermal growth factor-like domains protein 11 n=1 Tax=Owenia fusiformis TaxID=6347 RepID=A0A8S4P8Q2_OWEFU|nr:unnamed protein product [Owenia fusiformis]
MTALLNMASACISRIYRKIAQNIRSSCICDTSCDKGGYMKKKMGYRGNSMMLLLWILLVGITVASELSPNMPNVCRRFESFPITQAVAYVQPYEIRTTEWCWAINPRCTKIITKYRMAYRQELKNEYRTVYECCQGYAKSGHQCVPICGNQCVHGQCIAPNTCHCETGWEGATCSAQCPQNKWGPNCKNQCYCENGAKCDIFKGSCQCLPGWTGEYCNIPCSQGYFGYHCTSLCMCQNGATCDASSGQCYCDRTWTGPLCTERCPDDNPDCGRQRCICQNGGECNERGFCICKPGWQGIACAVRCPQGLYGPECRETCSCYNGATCDPEYGKCSCPDGYIGDRCEEECTPNRYGKNCTEVCQCVNDAICGHTDGRCACAQGYTGHHCEISVCPQFHFSLPECSETCNCHREYSKACHPATGECICQPGWSGPQCTDPCPAPFYGDQCGLQCPCTNGAYCDPIDGTCICAPGYTGLYCERACSNDTYGLNCAERCQCLHDSDCNHENGVCSCAPGWRGMICDQPCPHLTYGLNCSRECACVHGSCDNIDGTCVCSPGYQGDHCDVECDLGKFGLDCKQVCDCDWDNAETCDHVTGACLCKSRWAGLRCDSLCPVDKWGERCDKDCDCKNEGSCKAHDGSCYCQPGWTGDDCSQGCPEGRYGQHCGMLCDCMQSLVCDVIDGRCPCPPGYTGANCDEVCLKGSFGIDCAGTCDCKNTGWCNHINGECHCPPGFHGQDCSEACPAGFYGLGCQQECDCENGAMCQPHDGLCICRYGYMGPTCSESCPDGMYGSICSEKCDCVHAMGCDHVTGKCFCNSGFGGERCDKACPPGTYGPQCIYGCQCNATQICHSIYGCVFDIKALIQSHLARQNQEGSLEIGALAGIIVSVLLILLIFMVLAVAFYYRRKAKKLKEDAVPPVSYRQDPGNNFENPMYGDSSAGGANNSPSTESESNVNPANQNVHIVLLNNSLKDKNNSPEKTPNIGICKLGSCDLGTRHSAVDNLYEVPVEQPRRLRNINEKEAHMLEEDLPTKLAEKESLLVETEDHDSTPKKVLAKQLNLGLALADAGFYDMSSQSTSPSSHMYSTVEEDPEHTPVESTSDHKGSTKYGPCSKFTSSPFITDKTHLTQQVSLVDNTPQYILDNTDPGDCSTDVLILPVDFNEESFNCSNPSTRESSPGSFNDLACLAVSRDTTPCSLNNSATSDTAFLSRSREGSTEPRNTSMDNSRESSAISDRNFDDETEVKKPLDDSTIEKCNKNESYA